MSDDNKTSGSQGIDASERKRRNRAAIAIFCAFISLMATIGTLRKYKDGFKWPESAKDRRDRLVLESIRNERRAASQRQVTPQQDLSQVFESMLRSRIADAARGKGYSIKPVDVDLNVLPITGPITLPADQPVPDDFVDAVIDAHERKISTEERSSTKAESTVLD